MRESVTQPCVCLTTAVGSRGDAASQAIKLGEHRQHVMPSLDSTIPLGVGSTRNDEMKPDIARLWTRFVLMYLKLVDRSLFR